MGRVKLSLKAEEAHLRQSRRNQVWGERALMTKDTACELSELS